MDRSNGARGSTGCGGCLCLAFILVLFATVSPYWLWQRSWVVGTTATSTVATGSYVASSSSGSWYCGPFTTCFINSQWNYFDDFNSTICEGTNFDKVGKFGFCDGGENGQYRVPKQVGQIQALMVTSSVVLFFASIMAMVAPASGGSKVGFIAAVLALVATCTTCAAFSVAASYDWYQQLRAGTGFLPFVSTGSSCLSTTSTCLFISSTPTELWWGPAFGSTVTAFVISLFATASLFAVSKSLDSDDIDGTYGQGGQGDQGDGGQAAEYGYGVEKA